MDKNDLDSEAYAALNRAWKSTCKVVLGTEIGNLLEFEDYLKRYTDPLVQRKSALSGTAVTISSLKIPKNARVIGNDELALYEKKTAGIPFGVEDINNIKDIDSIIGALQEKAYYAGNIVLGNSRHVAASHRCMNTNYALGCQDVYDGKYTAFTTSIRCPEYSFGCCFGGNIEFCIKVLDPHRQTRCLETFHCNVASDSYYSASLEECTNCMFTFNQRNKHYMIGNVQLTKDDYSTLKNKLLSEIVEVLRKNKKLPSVIEIISGKGDWIG